MQIIRGDTWRRQIRLESGQLKTAPITAIDSGHDNVRLVVMGHGLPTHWRVAVIGGMFPGLTARNRPPRQDDFLECLALDADTLEVTNINGMGWPPYSAGAAVIQYGPPLDLSGVAAARMQFRQAVTSDLMLAELTLNSGLSVTDGAVDVLAPASVTAGLPAGPVFASLELTYADGTVRTVLSNMRIDVVEDVTR